MCLYSGSMDHREPLPMLWKTENKEVEGEVVVVVEGGGQTREMLLDVLSGRSKHITNKDRTLI